MSDAIDAGVAVVKQKLVKASVICAFFMVLEFMAGFLANSLALMTDATHLLSDLSSFMISLFAIWVAKLPGTSTMSFGYHRAEILGAIASVLMIWVITAGLVYEAIGRFNEPPMVKGNIMFATAFCGTIANIFMTYILGVHSHGLSSHSHEGGDCASSCGGVSKTKSVENLMVKEFPPQVPLLSNSMVQKQNGEGTKVEMGACCESSSKQRAQCSSEGSSHTGQDVSTPRTAHSHGHGHSHGRGHGHAHGREGGGDCHYEMLEDGGFDNREASRVVEENLNLRAAYIHALGDLIQNIGVMIAAALIWWKPEWAIADPICTLIFSAFVVMTTVQIIKEATNVLMEGVPDKMDVAALTNDLL
eukprot:Selendium_serpulae@DN4864_c0_g1_i2.p1